ncbi:hypothetical protein PROFUN_08825 [Planoprotostelium fungivorum]|uniref:Uncharacterized protein n=1 Tax=Planoprotostelium fungivorum TaxID=1890364 RepID=A0A2P6NIU8_9EUKA|nr:hypothetical protein PROFUN_15296 [Planoprotostelium fungivorum]PRP83888.1 hypothetical protein PROFUN_08825 [Planoprotostelium fungivorum]
MSYVTNKGEVRHRRLYKFNNGWSFKVPSYEGYTDIRIYKTMTDIMRYNTVFSHPLIHVAPKETVQSDEIDIYCKNLPPASSIIRSVGARLAHNESDKKVMHIGGNVFHQCSISEEDLIHIFDCLCTNSTVDRLHIDHTPLGVEACQACCKMLRENTHLKCLSLFHCRIEPGGLPILMEAIRNGHLIQFELQGKPYNASSRCMIRGREFEYKCMPWTCATRPR